MILIENPEIMANTESRRVKFTGFQVQHVSDGRCRARVELARQLNPALRQSYVGTAEGAAEGVGLLSVVAEATLSALERSAGAAVGHFRLNAVKTVEGFEGLAVIVDVSVRYQNETRRLVGFGDVPDDLARAAVFAVLSATNRFLSISI